MLERSDDAKFAKHVFFAPFNDLDIFIEDTAVESKKMYAQILRRSLGSQIQINQVFPIGSKSKVLAKCAENQGARLRKAVFIIDGDFDVLFGNNLPPLKRLYRLKRYCIENYLLDEGSVVSILDEEQASRDESAISAELDFPAWQERIAADLLPLVLGSCVAFHRNCGLATTSFPLSEISSCTTGLVDSAKITAKVAAFEAATDSKHGVGTFRAELNELAKRIPVESVRTVFLFASGKNILLPLLKRRLQSLFGFAPSSVSFKLRIALRCDVSEFADLVAAIE
jgi:hypothetical protein